MVLVRILMSKSGFEDEVLIKLIFGVVKHVTIDELYIIIIAARTGDTFYFYHCYCYKKRTSSKNCYLNKQDFSTSALDHFLEIYTQKMKILVGESWCVEVIKSAQKEGLHPP
jgi:hypothetical protein